MHNLILIGLPASGKTSAGRALARRLDMPFYDCDEAIEAAQGQSISAIFSQRGEAFFRDAESRMLEELCRRERCVIATGGGAVLRAQNVRALRQNGVVVYIDRPLGQLAVGGARPLSQSAEALAAMHGSCRRLYEQQFSNESYVATLTRLVKELTDGEE